MSHADDTRDTTNDPEGTTKPDGLGQDGTIPAHPEGVAAGFTEDESHFNQEEDESAE
ncbi:hypothetical protein [Curtobacterium sp. MCSS17_008]|uniref:hypothetical protein n=1 Tax=Curtobacterium sp. MCSS17_008 TaxID=2175647 RepID=UPI0015E8E1BC|nr:hypothetical protein [Curtobacterium sp. MCSS17_008]